jgi:hypothetical protein
VNYFAQAKVFTEHYIHSNSLILFDHANQRFSSRSPANDSAVACGI